jgi:hypothetical protein
MFEPFESPKLLVDRAKRDLTEFKEVESVFLSKRTYAFFTENDPKTWDMVFKAKPDGELPKDIPVIVFDVINCLRSSLDHAVYDSSALLGGDSKPKYTKFPFGVEARTPKLTRPGRGAAFQRP